MHFLLDTKPFLLALLLILLNGGELTLKGSQGLYHRSLVASPEIRVSKWISSADRDYDDETWDLEWNDKIDTDAIHVSGFGSHEYIVSQHVSAIVIECRAQYPVEWEFHNAYFVTEDLHGIQMKTFRRSKSVTDPKDDVYSTTLEISAESNRATGNYSCRSTQDHRLSNSIFLFWEGSSPPYLVLSGKVAEIHVESNKDSIELPCYVSNPDASVKLLKEDKSGEFQATPTSISAQFDPKIGFTLKFRNVSDVTGRYRCVSGVDEAEIMETLIRKGSADTYCEDSSCLHRQLSSGTSFYFDENSEELVCCGRGGSSTKPTQLHTMFCWNPSVCRMFEPSMYLSTGSNGKRYGNGSCVSEKIYPRDMGLVRCKGEGIDVFTYVYTEFWTAEQENLKAVFDWKQLNPKNMIHIMIHAPLPLYKDQMVTATCQTLHSYFSDGIKWAIKWQNGTLSYFDSLLGTENNPRLHGIRSTYLKLTSSMAELICFAPQWNSTNWVEKGLKLDLKQSQSPTIVGNTVEELTFSLNDTEKIIECVSNAEPPAKIKWTKNDEEVPRSMVIWTDNGTSFLLFKQVSHQTQAEYKCIAKNAVGKVKKIFRVFVEDARHSTWSTAFAVVIPILVISFIGIFAFLMWKMQLQKKVVNHLTQVVFRDANASS